MCRFAGDHAEWDKPGVLELRVKNNGNMYIEMNF